MHHRTRAVLWLAGLQVTGWALVIGVAIAGVAATFGGSGAWGAVLVLCSAVGAVMLGLTSGAISNSWPGEKTTPMVKIAIALSGVIALVATYLLIDLLLALDPGDGWFWRVVPPIGVAGAWVAFFGWVSDRRLLAAAGHLISLVAPWGYAYPAQLVAIGLALAAGATFQSSKLSSSTPR